MCIRDSGKAMADLITMADEVVETQHGITLFDPIETWKECTYVNCTARCPVSYTHLDVYKRQDLVRAKCGGSVEVSHISGGQPVYYYICLLYTSRCV